MVVVEHQSVALRRRRDWALTAISMAVADRIVMLSPAFAAGVQGRIGPLYRKRKVALIPNGVDTALFTPGPLGPTDPFRIGMAARFIRSKRHDLLIKVLTRLRTEFPDGDWILSFAGAGEELDRLQRETPAAVAQSIIFEGVLDEQQLAEWYRSLRVYALATDGETFNTSVLQAMASGLPVLASDVTGLKNQVSTDFGVLLPNEAQSWVNAFHDLSADLARATAMGTNARRHCLAAYSAENMFRNYDRLIDEIRSPNHQAPSTSS